MMVTIVYRNHEDSPQHTITFTGAPDAVQAELKGFVAGGLWLEKILILGEK